MNIDDLDALVRAYFGTRCSNITIDRTTETVSGVLYETFVFSCGLKGEHRTFNGGVEYAERRYITNFLGQHLSFNTDEQSISENLRIIDAYCRLRLPRKFLSIFEYVDQ